MPWMFSEADLAAMDCGCGAAFDPDGLCNPGKLLPTPRLCGEVPGPYRRHPARAGGGGGTVLIEHEPRRPDRRSRRRRHAGRAGADARASAGQMLALDPPGAERLTVAEAFAAAVAGPRAHGYGMPRDLLLGVALRLPDGSLVHGGGRVVKNVAGYDLPRLFVGAAGRLGLIRELTRAPAPAARRDVHGRRRAGRPARARAAGAGLRRVRLAAGAHARALREPGGRRAGRAGRGARRRRARRGRRVALGRPSRGRPPGLHVHRAPPGRRPGRDRRAARSPGRRGSSAGSPAASSTPTCNNGVRPRCCSRSSSGWWRPSVAEASTRELLDACVHCGFCLPACPTYSLWGDESDSPRGRIHLMSWSRAASCEWRPVAARHFDRCLGCLACVPACPSGVRYDLLIERTRADGGNGRRGRLGARPRRRRSSATVAAAAAAAGDLAGRSRWASARSRWLRAFARPTCAPARRRRRRAASVRMPAALLEGCVQRVLFGRVNRAAARRSPRTGARSSCRRARAAAARSRSTPAARRRPAGGPATVAAFAGHDRVVVTAAGCGSAMKGYGDLLGTDEARRFSATVRDVPSCWPSSARRPSGAARRRPGSSTRTPAT